ncbi:hypothetical protein ES708_24526 [subsurface metagenome]
MNHAEGDKRIWPTGIVFSQSSSDGSLMDRCLPELKAIFSLGFYLVHNITFARKMRQMKGERRGLWYKIDVETELFWICLN